MQLFYQPNIQRYKGNTWGLQKNEIIHYCIGAEINGSEMEVRYVFLEKKIRKISAIHRT